MADKNLDIALRFLLDKNSLQNVKNGTMSIEEAIDNVNAKLYRTQFILNSVSQVSEKWSRGFQKSLIGSVGVLTSIFLIGQKYIKTTEEQTVVTRRWEQASKRVEQSQLKISRVIAEQTLPLYEKASRLAEQIAAFVEQNPELVKTALNIAVFTAGISALGIAVTKGIKLVADITYIATAGQQLLAAKLMNDAANKQVAASTAMSGGQIAQQLRGAFGFAPAGAISPIASAALIVTGLVASGFLITIIDDMISKTALGDRIQQAQKTIKETSRRPYPGVLPGNEIINPEGQENILTRLIQKWKEFVGVLEGSTDEIDSVINQLRGSKFETQIVESYTRMREEQKQADEQYKQDVLDIIQNYNQQILSAETNNKKAIAAINSNYQKTIASLTANYLQQSQRAEQEYALQRQQIIRDSAIEIQRMEEDLQNRLLKLRRDHEDKVNDLVAKRDALGLIKQVRDYNRQRDEEIANTNKEIARRRQDLAIRLNDIADNYRREREMRLEEYQQSLKEAEERRNEQLKQQNEYYQEELKRLREAKNQQLVELQRNYQEEARRRREAFIAMVRDLDASLINEQRKKQQYYALMLADAERFLAAYRSKLPTGGNIISTGTLIPNRDTGGYANKGLYGLAMNGKREFVMSGNTTSEAERIIGNNLTQHELLRYLVAGKNSINYYDNSRYDGRISNQDKRWIQRQISDSLKAFANGI